MLIRHGGCVKINDIVQILLLIEGNKPAWCTLNLPQTIFVDKVDKGVGVLVLELTQQETASHLFSGRQMWHTSHSAGVAMGHGIASLALW